MIKDTAFVAYSVKDVPRAVAFYRDVIGLKPGESFGEHWAEFDAGATTFGVGNGSPLGIEPGSSFAVTFEVDDINKMREKLVQGGVKVTELMDAPSCVCCFVTDPDGNRFGLHQRKA